MPDPIKTERPNPAIEPLVLPETGLAFQGSRGGSTFQAGLASDAMRLRPHTARLQVPTDPIKTERPNLAIEPLVLPETGLEPEHHC